jgi:hypothetical protein
MPSDLYLRFNQILLRIYRRGRGGEDMGGRGDEMMLLSEAKGRKDRCRAFLPAYHRF